jgi:hypothetical protein
MRGALQLRSPHLVTAQAKFGLSFLQASVFCKRRIKAGLMRQRRMQFLMSLVAVHASHSTRFMWATSPKQLVASRMALQACEILLG